MRITFILFFSLLLSIALKAQLPTAQQIASKITIGWNLGNTLEATWVPRNSFSTTTQAAIDSVKAAGFNTVRLPVAWFYHSDTVTSVIDEAWLAHVKKVVDYCINDSLYVIINAHWDKGWLENRVNTANKDIVNERQQKYWTQIANYFNEYDEHLLFAGANEPNVHDAAGMSILLSYHQTFIDAVRATGGNNSSRTLVIQGPSTDISNTDKYMNTLPEDEIENRLIVEVHYYTPWNFCGLNGDASWGKMFYYWGRYNHSTTDVQRNATWGEESEMEKYLGLMKTKFIDKGIPVIIGEYGAFRRKLSPPSDQALHNASIAYYYKYFVKSAMDKGMITYCWDTGGIFNFTTGKVNDKDVLDAIMVGAGIITPASYTLNTAVNGSGSISISPDLSTYIDGSVVTVTAMAGANAKFESWSSDLEGSTNPATVIMKANHSIIANFTDTSTGINNLNSTEKAKVYPNPFSTACTIMLNNLDEINHISVFDLLGQKLEVISHLDLKSAMTFGASLKSGTYIVQVYRTNSTESYKIVKNELLNN